MMDLQWVRSLDFYFAVKLAEMLASYLILIALLILMTAHHLIADIVIILSTTLIWSNCGQCAS